MVDLKGIGEGLCLDGTYTFEHWMREDASGTFFAARRDDGEQVMVKLLPENMAGAEAQQEAWQRSRHLRHAHLQYVYDSGYTEIAGTRYVYGVFERPDDVVAGALEQGPLSEEESRGVVEAALSALRYLHSQGMVHGSLDPNRVIAVGDAVKLATDSLREADGSEGHAEDARQLGVLIQSLRSPEMPGEPLATVMRHATEPDPNIRWTLAEMAAALAAMPVVPVEPVIPPRVEDVKAAPVTEPMPLPQALPASPVVTLPPPRIRREAGPRRSSPGGFPRWIFAGVAIVLLSILAFNLRRKTEPAPSALTPTTTSENRPAIPAAAAPVAQPERPSPMPAATGKWRVIAYTYTSHDIAAKKAAYVNKRWPDLHATVLASSDRRGYFLVALGGSMKRDEANRLQHKARTLGLPRDTYVQNTE